MVRSCIQSFNLSFGNRCYEVSNLVRRTTEDTRGGARNFTRHSWGLVSDDERKSPADWRPVVWSTAADADRQSIARLIREDGVIVCDTIVDQLRDLAATREPAAQLTPTDLDARVAAILDGKESADYGNWIHFPWLRRLVHLLPSEEFQELRTDRNRYKILPAEQRLLRERTIAIAGLSVGQSAALTLALEGVGGRYRLADFDDLSLSNLNRLRAGVHDLGVNKAVLTARALYELNPYLDVEVFTEGVTEQNLDRFLERADLLVEECDDLYMKVRLRERARELRIPVIMDTSDAGLLDIERFDREPDRPLFHGIIPDLRTSALKGLATREKLPFVLAILGTARMTPALAASLFEVKETITTWPQLGSGVTLGAALVTDTARRLLIGQIQSSGRFYVDLGELVRDGAGVHIRPASLTPEIAHEAQQERTSPPMPTTVGEPLTRDEARYLVAHAVLAPSEGNKQPWRFLAAREHIDCYLDESRSGGALDADCTTSYLAMGAAVENIVIAASALSRAALVTRFPDPKQARLVCRIFLPCADVTSSPLLAAISRRTTNRRLGSGMPLAVETIAQLQRAITMDAVHLAVTSDGAALSRVAAAISAVERLQLLSPQLHGERFASYRWTADQVRNSRDGIDVATLELSSAERALLDVLASDAAMRYVARIGGGSLLMRSAQHRLATSSALGLLSVVNDSREAFVDAGRQLQRIWLVATTANVSIQPLGSAVAWFRQLPSANVNAEQAATLAAFRDALVETRLLADGEQPAVMLRLMTDADSPTARSLRRSVEEVLSFKDPA